MKDTRMKIVNTAIELHKINGYDNTTVTDICRACNISKGTFYYHFPNKDEISFEYYDNMLADFSGTLTSLLSISNAKEQLWKAFEYPIDCTIELGPKLLTALFLSDIQKGLTLFSPYGSESLETNSSRQIKLHLELIKKGQKTGEIKQGDPVIMIRTFVSALIGIAITWCSNDAPFDEKEELKKAFDLIF